MTEYVDNWKTCKCPLCGEFYEAAEGHNCEEEEEEMETKEGTEPTVVVESEILDTQLAEVEKSDALNLKSAFLPYFEEAEKLAKTAKGIVVTNAEQTDDMKQARECRLALKTVRCAVENTRKLEKEGINRKAKAIDGLANVIKFLIVPIEEHLREQEDFVKIQEEERKSGLRMSRRAELDELGIDTSFYDLGNMPEDQYKGLLEASKETHRLKQEAAAKAEQDRIAREKAEQEQQEKIAKENERLKKEAEEKRKEEEAEQKQRDEEEAKRKEREEKDRKAREKKEKEVKEANDKKLAEEKKKADAEREKREAVEREVKAKEERDAQERKEKADAEAKEKREAELAPDRAKLEALAVSIASIPMPSVKSKEARELISVVVEALSEVCKEIREATIKL